MLFILKKGRRLWIKRSAELHFLSPILLITDATITNKIRRFV